MKNIMENITWYQSTKKEQRR